MEYGCIYMIMCMPTKKVYIGQSINWEKRKSIHFSMLRNNHHNNKYLQNSFNKYSESNFKWFILQDYIPKNELNKYEKQWIKKFNSFENGFNGTYGGDKPLYTNGENHPTAKITEQIVLNIVNSYLTGNYSTMEISKKYNISIHIVRSVICAASWKHITHKHKNSMKEIAKKHKGKRTKYMGNPKETVYNGKTYKSRKELKKELGVSYSTLYRLLDNQIEIIGTQHNCRKIIIEDKEFMSISKAYRYYGCSRNTIYDWLKSGKAQYVD